MAASSFWRELLSNRGKRCQITTCNVRIVSDNAYGRKPTTCNTPIDLKKSLSVLRDRPCLDRWRDTADTKPPTPRASNSLPTTASTSKSKPRTSHVERTRRNGRLMCMHMDRNGASAVNNGGSKILVPPQRSPSPIRKLPSD